MPDETEAVYQFPFEVPADLSTLDDDGLTALLGQIREHAGSFAGLSPADTTDDTLTALRACRDLAVTVNTEITGRRETAQGEAARADELAALSAELETATTPPEPAPAPDPTPAPTPAPTPPPAPTAVTAASRRPTPPPVRTVASGTRTPALPQEEERTAYASMTAAADVPNFSSGQRLTSFTEAARALSARLDQYPAMSAGQAQHHGNRRPVTAYDPSQPARRLVMTNFARHSAVQFRREFPDELRVREGDNGHAVAEYAASERRLPGGNLMESARRAAEAGRSLTAAAGWCAPSETIYDLLELETLDGILDLPELQTTRGGWQIPDNGGPDFATIYNGIGDSGDTHLTEAEVIADTAKVCTDIPCPTFTDVRLGVDYVCLTGGLLQRRGYPEVVARWGRGAMTALAHKINQGVIAAIVAGSGAATVIPADTGGDDAIASLLSAVELAIEDAKYRNRMGFNATLEVVLPHWVLVQMRAAGSRRSGVDMVGLTDAQILEWFRIRHAVPRFVYDWQDQFSGLGTGPGGSSPLTALPVTVQFVVYPAGTWVKAMQDVVQLDTIYDSTKLATNEYTAVFAEDGWAALKMSPTSRLYTAPVDPSGDINIS